MSVSEKSETRLLFEGAETSEMRLELIWWEYGVLGKRGRGRGGFGSEPVVCRAWCGALALRRQRGGRGGVACRDRSVSVATTQSNAEERVHREERVQCVCLSSEK